MDLKVRQWRGCLILLRSYQECKTELITIASISIINNSKIMLVMPSRTLRRHSRGPLADMIITLMLQYRPHLLLNQQLRMLPPLLDPSPMLMLMPMPMILFMLQLMEAVAAAERVILYLSLRVCG